MKRNISILHFFFLISSTISGLSVIDAIVKSKLPEQPDKNCINDKNKIDSECLRNIFQ